MTFESNIVSTQSDALPELYQITSGGYEWCYTSYRRNLTFLGKTYRRGSIERSSFVNSRNPGESRVTLRFPLSDPLQEFISAFPPPSTEVNIYKAVYEDLTQYALIFSGKVRKTSIKDKMISVECSIDDEMAVMMPTIIYQSYCNWQVFDCDCGLLEEDYRVTAVISSLSDSGRELISSAFSVYAADWFTQGRIQFGGDHRFVVDHSGSTVKLQLPFPSSLAAGATVYAFPGCDGSPSTCKTKFDNFLRICAMPYIPSHNPVLWGFK